MRRLSGFSLMEMMVVLLITAIVAAASAPMINKKLIQNQAENSSPWTYISNLDKSIAFNMNNNDSQSVLIGTTENKKFGEEDYSSKLYIKSKDSPHMAISDDNNNNLLFYTKNESAYLSSRLQSAKKGVIIGYDAQANDAGNTDMVAIGYGAKAAKNSIAIGSGAKAIGANSIAIGKGVKSEEADRITIGDRYSTVYIPGNLVVGYHTYLGHDSVKPRLAIGTHKYSTSGGFVRFNVSYDDNGYIRKGSEENSQIEDPLTTSDRRLKNVGKVSSVGLEEVKKLEVFNFTYKKDKSKTPHVGVMAQDLEKIFPNAVFKGEDGFLRIRTEDMFYSVVNAVKELDKKISLLEQKQKRIDELEARLEKLEKRLEKMSK